MFDMFLTCQLPDGDMAEIANEDFSKTIHCGKVCLADKHFISFFSHDLWIVALWNDHVSNENMIVCDSLNKFNGQQ